ncbi:hypothetical protein [Actinomadura algeriensis]|uniref:YD repeat-containing protein n=1 Tax=Actinomadura algeriensis TaxID=1679523 RepID=A0ABR9K2D3_9ACTN|nr:hypothetical protein [Actinomadura algeriensis]MBE1536490.1 hypothetical protein [Actinomadura algeriensis]
MVPAWKAYREFAFRIVYDDGAELESPARRRAGDPFPEGRANRRRWSPGGEDRVLFATRPPARPSGGGPETRSGVLRAMDRNGRVIDEAEFRY